MKAVALVQKRRLSGLSLSVLDLEKLLKYLLSVQAQEEEEA